MQIRKALPQDKEQISNLYSILFAESAQLQPSFYKASEENGPFVESILADEKACFFVAQDGELIKGFVLVLEQSTPPYPCLHQFSYAYLLDTVVLPQCRGQGIGTALIGAVKEWAKERNLHHVALTVLEENFEARKLYERNSFRSTMRTMRFMP